MEMENRLSGLGSAVEDDPIIGFWSGVSSDNLGDDKEHLFQNGTVFLRNRGKRWYVLFGNDENMNRCLGVNIVKGN